MRLVWLLLAILVASALLQICHGQRHQRLGLGPLDPRFTMNSSEVWVLKKQKKIEIRVQELKPEKPWRPPRNVQELRAFLDARHNMKKQQIMK